MDLWIRSQNGRFSKVDDIMQPIEDEFDGVNGWVLYVVKQSGAMSILGIYETEERAIEVLDEIQNRIACSCQLYTINRVNFHDCTGTHEHKIPFLLPVIYEMPKE